MEYKHVAESVNFNLKELFEICSSVIYESDEDCDREVLKVAKALILHSYFADGNHSDDEDKLYEMAAEILGEFYDKNVIEHLYYIDYAEF